MPTTLPASLRVSLYNTKVDYRYLGKSGLRVSVPILGALSFGDPMSQEWALGEGEALPLLKAAYDRGVNTWDTANIYSNGSSEEIIGKALKKYGIPREKVVILTKCYGDVGQTPDIKTIVSRESGGLLDILHDLCLPSIRRSRKRSNSARIIKILVACLELLSSIRSRLR